MSEKVLKSYDPLAYYVNTHVADLDPQVVKAHKEKDANKTKELLSRGKGDFDVFICVNKHAHAFVLCAPSNEVPEEYKHMISDDPFDIPESLLCWRFELCFENEALRMYKIRKEFSMFKDLKERVHKAYYIGKYKEVAVLAFHFAALRSAPHRYSALLSDCVEFSKEFCMCLLSYCNNWKVLEEEVTQRIKKASATGLSLEQLSRRVRTSGLLGNFSLTGVDTSLLWAGGRCTWILIVLFILLILVYPILVAIIVAKLLSP